MLYTFNQFDRVKPSPLFRQQFPKRKDVAGSIERGGDTIVTVRWDRKRGVEELHVDYLIATGENWAPVPSQFRGKRNQIYHECTENIKVLSTAVKALRVDPATFNLAKRVACAMNRDTGEERTLIDELAKFGFVVPFPKRFINKKHDENQL